MDVVMTTPKAAVVTGSTKGWGRAVAEGLASAGVHVVVNGRNEDVDAVVREIREGGGEAIGVRVASDTAEGVDLLMSRALEAFGAVDIWVNSLGIQRPESLLTLDAGTWDEIIRIQLTSVFLGTQRAATQMIAQGRGGRIINVVGGGAYGLPGASAHAASKGGALSATYSWAEELRPHGITVNAIRGGVQSPGMRAFMGGMGMLEEDAPADVAEMRAQGFYSREEAAPLPAWLASDLAGDVSGYHIGIDGPRILVYERVRTELEIYEDGGWTVETLESRLHAALRKLPPREGGPAQRRPTDGSAATFDEQRPR